MDSASKCQTNMKNIFAICFLFMLAGCDLGGIRGNGHLITEQRNLEPFVNIHTGGAFRIDWRSGAPSASVTIDENLLQYLKMEVRDRVLYVRTARSVRPSRSIKLTVTSSALEGASFSGASRLEANQLSGPKFYLESTGASNVILGGTVDELVANLTGASDLRAESLQTKSAELSVTGAGDARVAVSDDLKVSITGAGRVEYVGNPHIERDITGAGSIRQREK
jgi:Putative auto-transporter adhesin, head GIN domain